MEMKPIAWMSPDGKVSQTEGKLFHIPLYAAQKPLSDDEINEIAMYCSDMNEYGHSKLDEFAFARAIEERHGIK